jgi:hypothetical protein
VGLPGTLISAGTANVLIAVVAYFASKGIPARLDVAAMPAPRRATGEEKPLLAPLLASRSSPGSRPSSTRSPGSGC